MNATRKTGELGVDEQIQQAIRRYYPQYPTGLGRQQLASSEEYLLASILRQLEGTEPADYDLEADDQEANYFAETYTATADGPRVGGEEPEEVDGAKVDLGDRYDAVDLRFDDDVVIAFKNANNDHRDIKYGSENSPVVGRPAQSRYVWIRRADSATSDPTVHLEAYDGE